MRVALVTNFPARFVNEKIIPDLQQRGIHIAIVETPTRAARIDLGAINIEQVLFMNELTSHGESDALSDRCKDFKIPIRALSRKKASWPWPVVAANTNEEEKNSMRGTVSTATGFNGHEHTKETEKEQHKVARDALVRAAEAKAQEAEALATTLLEECEQLKAKLADTSAKLIEANENAVEQNRSFAERCQRYEVQILEARNKPAAPSSTDKIVGAMRTLVAEGLLTREEAASKLLKALIPEVTL